MSEITSAVAIAQELEDVLGGVNPAEAEALSRSIRAARAVFVAGAGRSALMMKAFAMRLMQIGLRVYVVGEVVTPAIGEGDLLVIGSGSGETGGLALNAQKAKKAGATLALITTNPASTIGKLADTIVCVPVGTEKVKGGSGRPSIQPGGSAFEQSLLLLGDAVVLELMAAMPKDTSVMTLHANLE